jgi:hypothetical protein
MIPAALMRLEVPQTLDPRIYKCVAHSTHTPIPWRLEKHHVLLLAWTKLLGQRPSRTVPICPTGHDQIHAAISQLVTGNDELPHRLGPIRPFVEEAMAFFDTHYEKLATLALQSESGSLD